MSYIGLSPTTAAFPFDQFSGNASTTAFTLSQAPASTTSIVVAVSGVVQNPNTYSVSNSTLTFTGAPPSGTNNIGVLFLGLPSIVGVPNAATVGISQLSATGSPSSSTFLRGDNTWNGVASLTTASGTAPSYSARAWVNFNGTGTVAIRASGNCSSVTDNGTGDYTINFATAMADANYCFQGNGYSSKTFNENDSSAIRTVNALKISVRESSSNIYVDTAQISVAIFR